MRSWDGALTEEEQQAQYWDVGIVKPSLSLIQIRYAPPQEPPTQTRPLLSSLLLASVAHRSSTPTMSVASVEGVLNWPSSARGSQGQQASSHLSTCWLHFPPALSLYSLAGNRSSRGFTQPNYYSCPHLHLLAKAKSWPETKDVEELGARDPRGGEHGAQSPRQ